MAEEFNHSPEETERFQYFSDTLSEHTPEDGWEEHLYDQGGAADLFAHDDGLFDQDETTHGGKINEADGARIDNSAYTGLEDLVDVEMDADLSYTDVLPPLDEEIDRETKKFLAEAEAEEARTKAIGELVINEEIDFAA